MRSGRISAQKPEQNEPEEVSVATATESSKPSAARAAPQWKQATILNFTKKRLTHLSVQNKHDLMHRKAHSCFSVSGRLSEFVHCSQTSCKFTYFLFLTCSFFPLFYFSRVDLRPALLKPSVCGWDCNGTHNAAVILSPSWLWGPFPSHGAQDIPRPISPVGHPPSFHTSDITLQHCRSPNVFKTEFMSRQFKTLTRRTKTMFKQ